MNPTTLPSLSTFGTWIATDGTASTFYRHRAESLAAALGGTVRAATADEEAELLRACELLAESRRRRPRGGRR